MSSTFIDRYLHHTSIYESPTSFWKWSSYATIAGILRDNCYKRQGDGAIYTNIYVLFLAESSGHRKGPPVNLSEKLTFRINNTKIISGRASVQAIMDELSRAETDKITGKILKAGSAIFYAPELSAGIVSDPEAFKILTDIYDYKPTPYKNRLRTGPCFTLDRIVFSMLAASNIDMLKGSFNTAEVKGGLLARTFLVTPNEFRPSNSLMRLDPAERKTSLESVYKALEEISRLKGEFLFDESALKEYESWYDPFRQSYAKRKEASGVVGRVHTSVLKLAMILAANENELFVRKEHVEQAINECMSLIPNYNTFTMATGKSTISEAGATVLADLVAAPDHKLERKLIVRRHWQDIEPELLDKVIVAFEQSGFIKQCVSANVVSYQLTDVAIATLEEGQDRR